MSTTTAVSYMQTTEARIQELAKSFPLLRNNSFVVNWDPTKLDEWAASVASHGELFATQFVLSVWNQFEEWKCGRFDTVKAFQVWDGGHWEAFLNWAADPFVL